MYQKTQLTTCLKKLERTNKGNTAIPTESGNLNALVRGTRNKIIKQISARKPKSGHKIPAAEQVHSKQPGITTYSCAR